MKFTLTITDASASDLSRLLATLGGSTAVAVTATPAAPSIPPMPQNGGNDDDEGDGGSVNANAPAVDSAGLPVGPEATFNLTAGDTQMELYVRYERQ